MKKLYTIFVLAVLITSCSHEDSEKIINKQKVDWKNNKTCSASVDNKFLDSLIQYMTLEQKVGQIIMPDIDEVTPQDAKEFQLGTFLNGGGKFPNKNKNSTAADWKKLSEDFYNASPVVNGVVIPILWGTDAVHGHNNVIGATIFPHNIGLGSTMNPELIKKIGEAVAKEVLSTGIPWTFAPTIAVPQNDLWGRTYEGYSENPELVSLLGEAMILGLQGEGDNFLDSDHVLATAKHFLGDGGTRDGIDQGNTILSEKDLRKIHGEPYFAAISSCIQTVMASFNSWNGEKAHGSDYLLKDILRDQMGFDGLVVGDWNGHGQVPGCTKENCPGSFNAGVDIFMAPDEWRPLYKNTLEQVRNGDISIKRLDQAVKNILAVKYLLGMFDGRKPHMYPHNYIGDIGHREIARQAVRESIVLLKNNNNTLPIKSGKHILVVGESAKYITKHMGGWTITWQGRENANSEFPNSKSIYHEIKSKVESNGGSVEFSNNSSFIKKPDLVIFVYGEDPYAEGDGDRRHLFFEHQDDKFLKHMKDIKNKEIPSISLFISGRPLIVNKEIDLSDAFVQLWLPGTAIEGITDVIFTNIDNQINYDFKGKLSYSWPKFSFQTELNYRDEQYDPLFPYGYGLNYEDNIFLNEININEDIPQKNEITLFMGSGYPSYKEVISYYDSEKNKQIYEGISADIYKNERAEITISKFDYKKQDDAKTIDFGSKNIYKFWDISGSSENLSYMVNGALELVMRVKNISNDDLELITQCKKNENQIKASGSAVCYKSFDLSEALTSQPVGKWIKIMMPLACLDNNDFEISSITSKAKLATVGDWMVDVHYIKYKNNQELKSCKLHLEEYE
jgi:beta-glucosidase